MYSNDSRALTAATGVAFGGGFELRVELLRTASGALSIDTQPLFLAGSPGSAFLLPIGVSYRFR